MLVFPLAAIATTLLYGDAVDEQRDGADDGVLTPAP
jgi:hypothetical protein